VSSRRLLTAALCLIVGATGAGATWAAFSSSTENSGNSLTTGASFAHARVVTGTYNGDGVDSREIAVPFAPQAVIVKGSVAQTAVARTATMSGDLSKPMAGASAATTNYIQNLSATGFQVGTNVRVNNSGTRYDWVAFESAANVMQVGSYVGNGAARSITGVGFSPEYVTVLPVGTGRAISRASGQTTSFQFDSDTGNAARLTSLDADGFSLGTSGDVNTSGQVYHWIAWNDRGGLTDVSTYTGTGGAGLTAYTGFQPDYAIARENDTASAGEAHQRMSSQAAGNSYPFAASGALGNSITAFNSFDAALGVNAVANTNGSTHSLVAFKSRPYTSGGCSSPGTQTITANADSYVRQDTAGTNYGTATTLSVQSRSGSLNRRAFVRFNLPAIPSGCTVAFAKLRLNATAAAAARTLNAQTPSAAWTEAGITWTNQPAVTGTVQSALSATGYVEWAVTDQVRGQYTNNYGFRISDATENSGTTWTQTYNSREAASLTPQLLVTFQ
jgi:hypothetical protein